MIKKLHHAAYRCQDSERTRQFYEDFLGLPLVHTIPIATTKTDRSVNVLHTFYQLGDGSHLAFFEAPDMAFEFKEQHDFDLHIALEVDKSFLVNMVQRGKEKGIETRGIVDHSIIESAYFRDPNGYVVELCTKNHTHDELMSSGELDARQQLDEWTASTERKSA
ncbi:MAG: VOC family protein [Rhodothermales bacterium]|nr:VOC family protein [Rhodothermales bacterium]